MGSKRRKTNKIDEEIEESFPASDPPAFNATFIGAPNRRKSVKRRTAKKKPAKAAAKRPAKKKSVTKKKSRR